MLKATARATTRSESAGDEAQSLNRSVVALVVATGVAGVAIAAAAAMEWRGEDLVLLAVLAGFAAFTVRFDVSLLYQSRVSVTVVPILVAATIAGLPGVLVVALTAELAVYVGRDKPFYKSVFNAGALLVSGAVYILVLRSFPVGNSVGEWPGILYPVVAGTLANFLVNSALVACVISLASEKPTVAVWRENYSSLPPHYFLLGILVAGMVATYVSAGVATMALIFVPVVIVRFVIQVQQAYKDLQEAHQKILHLAYNDALTDLPNRQSFEERLTSAIDEASRTEERVAVVFLDLDQFKQVNDTMGHATGDHLLNCAAERLKRLIREGDGVARVGGDEFTLFFRDVKTVDEASRMAERVLSAFRKPWAIDGREVRSTASIGVAVYPEHGHDPRTLVKNADTAMYRVKNRGGNDYEQYAMTSSPIAALRSRGQRAAEQLTLHASA